MKITKILIRVLSLLLVMISPLLADTGWKNKSISIEGKVTGILHPVICTGDMDSALKFYRDILGLRVTLDHINDAEILTKMLGYDHPEERMVLLECPDGTEIELAEFRKPRGKPKVTSHWSDAGINLLSVCVSGIKPLMTRITAAGYRFTSELIHHRLADGKFVDLVNCYGPDDVLITLVEFE